MLDLLASFPKIDKFFSILNGIFSDCPGVSTKHIIAICMGMLALNSSTSVRKIYRLFANKVFKSHLNSYYHHLEYAKYDHNLWIAKLTRLALSCINAHNKLPVSLIIDDTIIKKFGQKFEAVSNLYDHSITDSENKYVNGHCFVCIVLAIPVLIKGNINYIRVPVGLKLWLPENVSDEYKTKIDMAYELLNTVKNEIDDNIQLVVVNDTWYSRDKIISFIKDNKNVEAVIAVRLNTVLYNKPTISKCGRGRPALKGKKINIKEDFELHNVPESTFSVGQKEVKTRLFGLDVTLQAILTYETISKTYRLYLCTNTKKCSIGCSFVENKTFKKISKFNKLYLPIAIYAIRWNIEVVFLEQKVYWDMNRYMLRKAVGIERLLNIQFIVYGILSLIPFLASDFESFVDLSIQDRRFELGKMIDLSVILCNYVAAPQLHKNTLSLETITQLLSDNNFGSVLSA